MYQFNIGEAVNWEDEIGEVVDQFKCQDCGKIHYRVAFTGADSVWVLETELTKV